MNGREGRIRRVPAALAAAAAFAVGVTGCANVPSGGRVVSGKPAERDQQADDPYVRLIPAPPRNDWTPAQTVAGFLAAATSFDDDHRVARSYLVRPTSWQPGERPAVTVVRDRRAPEPVRQNAAGTQATVKVAGSQLGVIGMDGQYVASPKQVAVTFELVRQPQGGWRIAELPGELSAGLLLTKSDLERTFRTLNLYFYAPDRRTLVPNGIFLPLVNRQQLPAQLVRALLGGPTSWLNGAVHSAFPQGTALRSLTLDKGVATVDLSRQARGGDPRMMSAQLGWTLRRLAEVRRLRLTIEGRVVVPAGGDELQPVDAWPENDPDGPAVDRAAYAVGSAGHLSRLNGDLPQTVAANAAHALTVPAVAPDFQEVAGLNADRDRLLAGGLVGNAVNLRTLLTPGDRGRRFTRPVFDRNGTLWTVQNTRDGSVLWSRPRGQGPARVRHWGLAGREVLAFEVARDGVRAAAIVKVDGDAQVQLGRILRNADGSLDVGSFLPLSSEIPTAEDLAWRDADQLAVLGRKEPDETVMPYLVPVGGAPVISLGTGTLLGQTRRIAAAPGMPILIGTRTPDGKDRICRQRNPREQYSEWFCSIPGTDPTYPP
ncbi:LpqB family beta-propeller domain-containing protein [Actinomadura kijaniata]|uniref:LpqB family beta-propeller domain-containing protein n=1 Tax=Actinomadura kijaniata TaxID=46161 RepID=UPI003F1B7163